MCGRENLKVNRVGTIVENMNELAHVGTETIQTVAQKGRNKKLENNEQNFSDLWQNII